MSNRYMFKFISAFDQARGENPGDQVICYPGHITKISEIKTYLWHLISSLYIRNIPNHFLTFLPNNKGAEMNVAVNAIGDKQANSSSLKLFLLL